MWSHDYCTFRTHSPAKAAECLRIINPNATKLEQCEVMMDSYRHEQLAINYNGNAEDMRMALKNKNAIIGACLKSPMYFDGKLINENWHLERSKDICDLEFDIYTPQVTLNQVQDWKHADKNTSDL